MYLIKCYMWLYIKQDKKGILSYYWINGPRESVLHVCGTNVNNLWFSCKPYTNIRSHTSERRLPWEPSYTISLEHFHISPGERSYSPGEDTIHNVPWRRYDKLALEHWHISVLEQFYRLVLEQLYIGLVELYDSVPWAPCDILAWEHSGKPGGEREHILPLEHLHSVVLEHWHSAAWEHQCNEALEQWHSGVLELKYIPGLEQLYIPVLKRFHSVPLERLHIAPLQLVCNGF